MLAGGTDALYRAVLAASHQRYVRVEVWAANVRLEGDLEILEGGSLLATLQSRVARTVSLSVSGDLYPSSPTDLLAPFGNELRIFAGIQLGDGSTKYSWQVFRGRISAVSKDDTGACQLQAEDRGADIAAINFTAPENSQVGRTVSAEFQRLVSEALTDATFGDFNTFLAAIPQLTWEFDRASALDEMATSVGAMWWTLANGDFVLRQYPWTVVGNPVIVFNDGPTGSIVGFVRQRVRANLYNSVTMTSERFDGTTPLFFTATDTNPASPTYVNGPFGLRNVLIRLNTPQTQGTMRSAANEYLQRSTAATEEWKIRIVPDMSLELGDIIRIDADGDQNIIQVVTSMQVPLSVTGGDMTVTCRSQVVGTLGLA